MKKSWRKEISNWGKYPVLEVEEFEESSVEKIATLVQEIDSILPRGNARCYGDAALNPKIFSTLRLNKFLSFDSVEGIINCESGVLLADILEFSVPKGFFLPVTPGTKFVTVGGALASDVHGKNHHVDGCFSDHVLDFDVINEKGEILKCSRDENPDLFWSTVGGMGLTGIITRVKFQLKKIESSYIKQESIKAKNLDEIIALFEHSEDWTYTVAWIDCLQKGKNIGRSILMRGEHAKLEELSETQKQNRLNLKVKREKSIPFNFPSFVLNTLSVKMFNLLFYHKQTNKVLKNVIDYDTFFYPLDAIHHWNRIYGKNGFIQYQFVIPKEKGKEGLTEILHTIAKSGQGSFLAVLKLFGKNNPLAYNSFPIEGYTLALDFKMTKTLPNLVKELDVLVEKYDGRIYRAKDSLSNPSLTDYLKNTESKTFQSVQNQRIKNKI